MKSIAVALPVLTLAAACAVSTAAAGAATAAPGNGHGRGAVNFHTASHHRVVAPATTRPGVAHLRNTGRGEIIVVEAKHPKSASAAQVATALQKDSPKPLLKNYRLVAIAFPHNGLYSRLSRGRYFLAAGSHKIKASNIASMTVTGRHANATPPASHRLTITSERTFSLPSSLPASGWLHLGNRSSSLVDVSVLSVASDATSAQLRSLVAAPTQRKLEAVVQYRSRDFSAFEALILLAPNAANWVQYRDTPGRYVAVQMPFSTGGPGKLHRGQVRVLTLK